MTFNTPFFAKTNLAMELSEPFKKTIFLLWIVKSPFSGKFYFARCHIRPNQSPRRDHQHDRGGEMDLKALPARRFAHASRPSALLPRRAPTYPPFAHEPRGVQNVHRDNDVNNQVPGLNNPSFLL